MSLNEDGLYSMMVIVGAVFIMICVFGGFMAEHGNMNALLHPMPIELLIIFGSGVGGLVIASPVPLLKEIVRQLSLTMKPSHASKDAYMELLLCLYELTKAAKANPLSLEPHVEKPEESTIFKKYPKVLSNHHLIHFICDTLKVQVSSPLAPYDLEDLMDKDITAAHEEEHKAPDSVTRLGDAMPGLGIVAAVLGVVITMGRLSQGKEVIGESVASALVGTFLGILLSYGFIQPLAAKMANNLMEEAKILESAKQGLLAFAKECQPKVCVEFARRAIPPGTRPDFQEVDTATSAVKAA